MESVPPKATPAETVEFIGCLYRMTAFLLDNLFLAVPLAALIVLLFGDVIAPPATEPTEALSAALGQALPVAALTVLLPLHVMYHLLTNWLWSRTPGKWLLSCRLVDVRSGRPPSLPQVMVRYLGLFMSTLTLGAGFFLATRHPYRQAWHDRLARTAVVGDDSLRPLSAQERQETRVRITPPPWGKRTSIPPSS